MLAYEKDILIFKKDSKKVIGRRRVKIAHEDAPFSFKSVPVSNACKALHIPMGPPACNNGCVFCIDRNRSQRAPLSLAKIESELERFLGRTRTVVFSGGGEPTLNLFLAAAIEAARRRGYTEIVLVTNGRRLRNRDYCLQLLDAGLNKIKISLHGPDPAVHDVLAGSIGAFRDTSGGLENLAALRANRPFALEVTCVVVKGNFRLLRPIYDYVARFNADHLTFNVVEPLGRAHANFVAVAPPYQDILDSAHASGLDFRSPRLSLSCIPPCAGGFEGNPEAFWLASGKCAPVFDHAKWKVHGPPCQKCLASDHCSGIWNRYVETYGWGEFTPASSPRLRDGQTLRVTTGSPCDNRCIHCDDGPAAPGGGSTRSVSAALRRGWLEGYRRVEFGGGEILLNPRCEEWVNEARDVGYSSISIQTNGRALCLAKSTTLLRRLQLTEVIVRINAGMEPVHDAMARSPGSLRQALRGMMRLRSIGLAFAIRCRRHPDNLATLSAARQLALRLGARRFEAVESEA
jgi:MoaA/NifB/PqqE/SkfB family radical SAM enzyme